MDRKMFEGNFAKAEDDAISMNKERDGILADMTAKKERLAEIEGKPESTKETSEKALNFEQLKSWWKEKGLDKYFDLEKQVNEQEKYWQKIYGPDFKIDRSKIAKDEKLLETIEKGTETGCVNGIMLNVTPENISEEEAEMTEAQYAFHKLLESSGMDIWAKTGMDRWTKLELEELLKRYLPVECSDFDIDALQKDAVAELTRVIDAKGPAPKQKPGKVELFFTDIRQDIPVDQKLVNLNGEVVENPHSFIGAISNKISFTTPEQEIVLASQMYSKDKTYISRKFWEWLMAIVDHRDKKTKPPVSAAFASSFGGEFGLRSVGADGSSYYGLLRVRF